MFQHQGIWLPDGEAHFPEWMTRNGEIVDGKGTYQIKKIRATLAHVTNFDHAIDVGAHVGLWSMHLAPRFRVLTAFEPMEVFRECFRKNVTSSNVYLRSFALGNRDGNTGMVYDPKDSGGTHVGGAGTVRMVPLDVFESVCVGLIKIDCEGYELEVLRGAEDTIHRCRPVIVVEQKPHKLSANFGIKGTPAVDFLAGMGYRAAKEIGGDYIMVPS